MQHKIILSFLLLLLASCQELDMRGLIIPCAYDADERFAQSMACNQAKGELSVDMPSDEYHIYVAGDLHLVDDVTRVDSFLALTRPDPLTACHLFTGDLVSVPEAYPLLQASLQRHYQQGGDTVFTIAGNHEFYFDGWPLYLKNFGSSTYTLRINTPVASDLIICLESSTSSLGKSQSEWLLRVLKEERPKYRYCVVATHANFFDTDNSNFFGSNPPLTEVYQLMDIFQEYKVDVCLQAHDHHAEDVYFKGVRYVQTDPLKMDAEPHGYLQIAVDASSIKTEIVEGLRPAI